MITISIQALKMFLNPTDHLHKGSIHNLLKMFSNITETESSKLSLKKISFMKILPLSETYPTSKVNKLVPPSFFPALNLMKKRNFKNWKINLKLFGKVTSTSLKLSKSTKNFKKSSKKLSSKSSHLLTNTIVNMNSNHSVKLSNKHWKLFSIKGKELNSKEPFTLILKRLKSMTETLKLDWNNSKLPLNWVYGKKLSKFWKISTV